MKPCMADTDRTKLQARPVWPTRPARPLQPNSSGFLYLFPSQSACFAGPWDPGGSSAWQKRGAKLGFPGSHGPESDRVTQRLRKDFLTMRQDPSGSSSTCESLHGLRKPGCLPLIPVHPSKQADQVLLKRLMQIQQPGVPPIEAFECAGALEQFPIIRNHPPPNHSIWFDPAGGWAGVWAGGDFI